jgi:hypothetical protein
MEADLATLEATLAVVESFGAEQMPSDDNRGPLAADQEQPVQRLEAPIAPVEIRRSRSETLFINLKAILTQISTSSGMEPPALPPARRRGRPPGPRRPREEEGGEQGLGKSASA